MVTISERATSRRSTMSESPSVDLEYVIDGTFDDFQVKGLMLSTAPTSYDGLPLNSITIKPMERPDLWEATASYAKKDKDGEDDADPEDKLAFSFARRPPPSLPPRARRTGCEISQGILGRPTRTASGASPLVRCYSLELPGTTRTGTSR